MVQHLSTLRGSSAEALQVIGERGDGFSGTLEETGALGADLFALAAVLRAQPALRRALTDVSTPVEARVGLVRNVFEGKVGAPALDLLVDAAERRWLSSRDLPEALEQVGVSAVVRSAGKRDAGRLADELFTIAQLVEENADLRTALSDPVRSVNDKRTMLRALLDGRVLPATMVLVDQALAGTHRSFHAAVTDYQRVAAATYGEGVARVNVAQELTAEQLTRLNDALSRQYDRPIHLNVEIDPDVLGGMRVEIGDDVIDGTVAARLDQVRRKLVG
jgi:F-type H+-transporting ATPase subunit delta